MSGTGQRAFYSEEAKRGVAAAIRDVETRTSAELVVALRRRSADYRDADYLAGAAAAFASLLALLFLPHEFAVATMPLEVAIFFALGALASARLPWLKRLFMRHAAPAAAVRAAARAGFFDMGVSRTTGRSGVLVYASLLERRVEVVVDVGIDVARLGPAWPRATDALEHAIAAADLSAFLVALHALGPILGAALPHQADDVDELPDELSVE